jgi:hypothetical protein
MMNVTKRLMFALLAAGSLASAGCYGTVGYTEPTAGVYVETAPPPMRVEYYDTRPGFVWIGGNWNWSGGQWVWYNGHYERERAGYSYAPGRWEPSGGRYVWVGGEWRGGGGGAVDHREPYREERREERRDERRDERREERRDDRQESRDHRSEPPPAPRDSRDHRH